MIPWINNEIKYQELWQNSRYVVSRSEILGGPVKIPVSLNDIDYEQVHMN